MEWYWIAGMSASVSRSAHLKIFFFEKNLKFFSKKIFCRPFEKSRVSKPTPNLQTGCGNATVAEAVECARHVPPQHAIEKSDEYFFSRADHGIMQFPFLPVVDNHFLTEEPLTSFAAGNFKKCPILLGVNQDEANWLELLEFLIVYFKLFSLW